jgi:hypothetical protein
LLIAEALGSRTELTVNGERCDADQMKDRGAAQRRLKREQWRVGAKSSGGLSNSEGGSPRPNGNR